MLFVIHGLDKAGALPIRMENYAAHRAYLDDAQRYGVRIVMSGPLVSDDGQSPTGSLIIVDAPSRMEAEAFHHADPFYKAALWQGTTVTAFDKKRG